MADFAAAVRRYMTERAMSLRALAKAAHYDQGTLSKILNGHKPATPYVAACLDEALGANGEIIAAAGESAALAEATRLPLRELADQGISGGSRPQISRCGVTNSPEPRERCACC